MVDTDVVFLFVDDGFEAVVEGDKFFFIEETFKEAVLCPLTKSTKGFVEFGAPAVVGDVVSDQVERCHWLSSQTAVSFSDQS
jgi:hypothetical protein